MSWRACLTLNTIIQAPPYTWIAHYSGGAVLLLLLNICAWVIFFRFIYLWLLRVFIAARRPSPVATSWGYSLVAVSGLLTAVVSLIVEHWL